jgi:hypothetical protein
LTLSLVLFGITALGGATLLALRLRGGNPPLGLAAVHGLLGASALVSLVVAVVGGASGGAVIALVLFGVAAAGGFALLAMHLSGKLLPVGLVLLHGTLAVAGYVVLLVHALGT